MHFYKQTHTVFWLWTLGLLLVLGSAGCGAATPPQPTATSSPPGAPLPSPSAAVSPTPALAATPTRLAGNLSDVAGSVLTVWHPWEGATAETLWAITADFNQNNPYGITVELTGQGSYAGVHSAIQSALPTSVLPDLVVGLNSQFRAWESAGAALADLSAYAADPEIGLTPAEQAAIYPAFWAQEQQGERLMALPVLRSLEALLYNQTWAQELGYPSAPATPEEFTAQACAAAQALRQDADPANDGQGGWIISASPAATLGWLGAFGAQIEDAAGGYTFQTPEVEAAFTFLKTLLNTGCAWNAASLYPNVAFANRQGLFAVSTVAGLPYQTEAFAQANRTDAWTVLPFPGPDRAAVSSYGPSLAIFSSAPERELAAWLYARHLLNPKNQARLVAASGYLPVTQAALPALESYAAAHPQWAAAQQLSASAQPEPRRASWSQARGALRDAASIWYTSFPIENLNFLLDELQRTADEMNALSP